MPDSACAEPAARAFCVCRTATAKVHCLNPRRVSVLPRFIAPDRRRAGASRYRLAAPMWDAPERWRKANVGARAPRGARPDGMKATRLAALSWPADRISEELVDLCNRGLRRLDINAPPAATSASPAALWSRPAQPTSADKVPGRRSSCGSLGIAALPAARRAPSSRTTAPLCQSRTAAPRGRSRELRRGAPSASQPSAASHGKPARSRLCCLAGACLLL